MAVHDYLRRLPPAHYQGDAWVHWTWTMKDRRTGWLDGRFLYKFRELQAHAAFRYQIACPIFCLMPDHVHLLWAGLAGDSDQRVAMKFLRREMNRCLKRIGYRLQQQAYDHVLREEERERTAIETVVEYIARNPERQGLVEADAFASYRYTGCLLPGFPEVQLFQPGSWEAIWRTMAFLRRTEVFRVGDPSRKNS